MTGLHWQPLVALERRRLSDARLNAHFALQWLARAARAFITPRPDDSHTNLGWDAALGGLSPHPLPDGSSLGLRINDLTVMSLQPNGASRSLALDGLADADVRAWLGEEMNARGYDASRLDAPSPYEMPAFAIADGARYAVDQGALGVLATWYANANQVLDETRQALVARGLNAPIVRCWPHHFDLDSLIYFPGAGSADVRTMGVGFSPGDEYYDEPYFYVSAYPAPAGRPSLPAFAHWHTHDFTAAVATASALLATPDRHVATKAYITAATEFAIKELGGASQARTLTSNTVR